RCSDAQTHALPGPSLDLEQTGPDKDLDSFGSKNPLHFFRDVRVFTGKQMRPVLDHGHFAAEASISLGELKAHVTAAEDDKVFRQVVEFEQLDVRHRPGVCQPGDWGNRGAGSEV